MKIRRSAELIPWPCAAVDGTELTMLLLAPAIVDLKLRADVWHTLMRDCNLQHLLRAEPGNTGDELPHLESDPATQL